MNWSDYDDLLNDKVMEHLGEPIIIHPDDNPITLLALVDIEGVNAEAVGGSVNGVVGKAQVLLSDAEGVAKGSFLSYQSEQYLVVTHPRKIDNKMCELELGVIGEQSVPDIRY